jgi:hypothetical protein
MSQDRKKLETAVEREVFKLVRTIKDHTRDFTVLKMRRMGTEVDNDTMSRVLDVVDQAVMDGFQKHIDRFMKELDTSLTSFTGEENPLQPSVELKKAKGSPKKKKNV